MAQQTAVEWLIDQVEDFIGLIPVDIIEQAKQMEREQVKEAFDYGDYCIDLPDGGWEQKYKSADQYYTQTYGK
jgi:hypothetical protein